MSKATTENQERTVATKGTDHVAQAVSPDMCFVPGKASPEPFDNYVESKRLLKGATTTVFISEQSVWTEKGELGPPSEPAHAGSAGGVKSGTYRFEAKATSYSRDVFCEGCAVVRTDDTTTQNHGNTDGIVLEGPLGTGDGSGVPGGDKAIVGHPVDAGTGRSFTDPIVDLSLPGPLLLTFCRAYSSSLATRDLGLGHGWTHSFAWQIELCPPGLQVVTSDGLTIDFARIPRKGRAVAGPGGWSVARRGKSLVLFTDDGLRRAFVPLSPSRFLLSEQRDAIGNAIRFSYDGARLSGITDSAGRRIRVRGDSDGRIAAIEVPTDATAANHVCVARYEYDDHGDLVRVTDAEGYQWSYAYDCRHLLVRDTDRCGLTYRFVYDAAGRCIETWGAYDDGRDPGLADDVPTHLADGVTPVLGLHHVKVQYRAGGATIIDPHQVHDVVTTPDGLVKSANADGPRLIRRYDERGFLIARGHDGSVDRFERDARGFIVAYTDPLGRRATASLDRYGLPTTIVDPAGNVSTVDRDARGLALAVTDPTGATSSYRYDDRGLVIEIVDRLGCKTTIDYDARGNPVKSASRHATWRWEYDDLGRPISEIDPMGRETRRSYSKRGDLIEVRDALGHATRYRRDGEGRLTELIHPDGRVVEFQWGHHDRLCGRRDPDGHGVELRYDHLGFLKSYRDRGGHLHRYAYDRHGRCVVEARPGQRRMRVERDIFGAAGSVVMPSGRRLHVARDLAAQPVEHRFDDGYFERYEYDARAAVSAIHWPGGSLRYTRDPAGRIVREVQVVGDEEHWVESESDAGGRRVSVRTSLGHVQAFTRDEAARRVECGFEDGERVVRHCDPFGREVLRELAGGGVVETDYDHLDRVAARRAGRSTSLAVSSEYVYDLAGHLGEIRDASRGVQRLRYDAADRLVAVERDGDVESYVFDAAGNRRRPHQNWQYVDNRLLFDGVWTYEYDEDGQLIERARATPQGTRERWRLEWRSDGKLRRLVGPDVAVDFEYDPRGRRLLKRVERKDGDVSTTRYVWDGDRLIHEIRREAGVVHERTYAHGDDQNVDAQRDAVVRDGRRRTGPWVHYVNDCRGAPDRLISGAGEIVGELERDPWGVVVRSRGVVTPHRLLGQYEDAESPFYFNRYRYYDPTSGRYIAPDPAGPAASDNLYTYPHAPYEWVDPLGLQQDRFCHPRVGCIDIPPPNGVGMPMVWIVPAFTSDRPGWFTVVAHGNPNGMVIPEAYDTYGAKDGYTTNAKDVANWIRAQRGYDKGEKVFLISCRTGRKPDGIAQRLADELNAPVRGASEYVSGIGPLLINSSSRGPGRLLGSDGVWRTFYPGKTGQYDESEDPGSGFYDDSEKD